MRDLRLLEKVDDTAVRVLLPNVSILKVDDEIAVWELLSLDSCWQSCDSLILVFSDEPAILLLGLLERPVRLVHLIEHFIMILWQVH